VSIVYSSIWWKSIEISAFKFKPAFSMHFNRSIISDMGSNYKNFDSRRMSQFNPFTQITKKLVALQC